MLAFVRVFAFYIGTAVLLTWGLFALGWADALEMDGFSNAPVPVVEQIPPRSQTVASAPVPDPVPKSALPRDARAPVAEPVVTAPAAKAAPAPVPAPVLAAPSPPPAALPAAVSAQPTKVAALPQAERAPPVEPPRQPEQIKPDAVRAPPPSQPTPPVEARPVPAVTPPPVPKSAPPPPAPPRQADLAPTPQPPAVPPSARPAPPAPPAVSRAPDAPRVARWAPVRRVAGFGHDALIDQLEDTRRTPDDVPCIVMRELVFKAGTAQFAPKTQAELQTVAKVLTLFPGQTIEIGSKLGPGRPMASDAKLRAERTRTVRDALISLGVAGNSLMLDPGEGYERVAEEVNRTGVPRVQSIGLCARSI